MVRNVGVALIMPSMVLPMTAMWLAPAIAARLVEEAGLIVYIPQVTWNDIIAHY